MRKKGALRGDAEFEEISWEKASMLWKSAWHISVRLTLKNSP